MLNLLLLQKNFKLYIQFPISSMEGAINFESRKGKNITYIMYISNLFY